jgi:Ca2+-binding EF-hand superfamily protein
VLLAVAVGLADVLFAVDSIPAVFGITTSALLVVACNAFALMGPRQLYALLAGVLDRIVYLNTGLGIVCGFIGVKLLLHALHESGAGWAPEIPAWLSVIVVVAVLVTTVLGGMTGNRRATVLERRFAVLDVDGNGVWQRDDYQQLTRRLCEAFGHAADSAAGQAVATGQRALFDALLPHMDADGDQQITPDEFIAALGRTIDDRPGFGAAVRTAARTLVQVADQDGNGALDPGEYARLAAVYGARGRQATRAFGRLDRDRNGLLDTAELAEAIGQFFTSVDPGTYGSFTFGHL